MISLPISVLLTKDEKFISLSTIKEHQNFCKAFLKSYHSFEKRKTEDKDKNKFKFEEDFFQTEKIQNQEEIMKWFSNLSEEGRIKICTIKNKWLINLLLQLYLMTKTYDTVYFKPIFEMANLFQDTKNFSHNEDDSYNNNNDINHNNSKNLIHDLNLYENFLSVKYPENTYYFNKEEEKKRDLEKEFIDYIKIINLDGGEQLDTMTIGRELLVDSLKLKKYLYLFSSDKCFQDWLLPIQKNNIYNFIFPRWMHKKEYLTVFEIKFYYIMNIFIILRRYMNIHIVIKLLIYMKKIKN